MKPVKSNEDLEEFEEMEKLFSKKTRTITRHSLQQERLYPLDHFLDTFEQVDELVQLLATSNGGDSVILMISSGGGRLDIADFIVTRIREAQSRGVGVYAELGFTVASAATFIALACDDWWVSKNCNFTIHPWSSGSYPDFAENVFKSAEFNKKQSDAFLYRIYKDFLTEEEIDSLITYPRDISFSADEVVERWIKKKEVEAGDDSNDPVKALEDLIDERVLEVLASLEAEKGAPTPKRKPKAKVATKL